MTRAQIGQPSCVPVDDCSAPFPPAGADVVVAANAPAPALPTITAALAAVPDGGTIAVDTGEYDGSVSITRSVHIIGRCASQVTILSNDVRGVFAQGAFNAEIRGITIRGGQGGLVAADGAQIQASHVFLTGSSAISVLAGRGGGVALTQSLIDGGGMTSSLTAGQGGGVVVTEGSRVTLDDVEVRNVSPAFSAYDASSSITVKRSLVSYLGPDRQTTLVMAWSGASVLADESAFTTKESALLYLGAAFPGSMSSAPARALFTSSELAQTGFNRPDVLMQVTAGASAGFDHTSIHHQSAIAVGVTGTGSDAKFASAVLRGESTADVIRTSLMVLHGGSGELYDTAVVAAIQNALLVGHPGSSLTLTRSLVSGTTFVGPGPNAKIGGSGIAVGVGLQARLTLTDSALVGNQQFGLYVATGSTASVATSLVDGTLASPSAPGGAVLVEDGAAFSLSGTVLRNNAEAALSCGGGGVLASQNTFIGNQVGVAADPARVVEPLSSPPASAAGNVVLYENLFFANGSDRGDPPTYLPGPGL